MDVLGGLKSFFVKVKHLNTDNGLFRLHYRFTATVLLAFSILVTSKQYIGDPIDCHIHENKIRPDMVDQYCWVSSTHTIPSACHQRTGSRSEVLYPCVGNRFKDGKEQEIFVHGYYQWVCFVLFLQAIMFYLPHFLWKTWEGGRLKALTTGLGGPLVSADEKEQRLQALTAYFSVSLHNHNFYVIRYVICEALNFVNVIGQMFLLDKFLGGTFLDYGTKVVEFNTMEQTNRTDPMITTFPRVTKCVFHTIGATGDVQNHDAICVLPINIINEKIYIALWFWFIILAIITGFGLIYRVATAFSAQLRYRLLKTRASSVKSSVVDVISSNVGFGDWFLLYLLSKNINSYIFRDVAEVVVKQLDNYDENPESKELFKKKFPL